MRTYLGKGVFAGVIKGRTLRGVHPGFSEDTGADEQSPENRGAEGAVRHDAVDAATCV